jgi:hypothetical protein
MRRPQTEQPAQFTPKSVFAGWDISFAALALACMSAGFWRLWPEATNLDRAPLGPVIIQAGLAALGFVAIASRWEDALRGVARNPLPLVFLGLACVSAIWAVTPTDALQQSILLVVIWCFGIGLALRFRVSDLAEICGFAGIFGLALQIAAAQGVPQPGHFDGDLAFALLGSLWAASQISTRRLIWLMAAGLCAAMAFAARDFATLGAGIGFGLGVALAAYGQTLARQSAVSVLLSAWVVVVGIIGATLIAMFGAGSVGEQVSLFLGGLGPHLVLGQGFGVNDHSLAGSVGMGLGMVGLGTLALVVVAGLCQIVFGQRAGHVSALGQAGALCACIGAWVAAPGEVAFLGPLTIIFAANCFAMSYVRAPQQHTRVGLRASAQPFPAPVSTVYPSKGIPMQSSPERRRASFQDESDSPTSFGLRPRL